MIGEKKTANIWCVVLASIPSSELLPKYQARIVCIPVEGIEMNEAIAIKVRPIAPFNISGFLSKDISLDTDLPSRSLECKIVDALLASSAYSDSFL